MIEKTIIQTYINNFRRLFAQLLKPGIGVNIKIFPCKTSGALIEINVGLNITSEDNYTEPVDFMYEALSQVKQKAFGGNLSGFKFLGTNIIFETNKILILKGEDKIREWNANSTIKDVNNIQAFILKGVHK
jgi:hypothetical protein